MLLFAIAGISLLVGGIGIMNMMLTTVTERTKEIGLREVVGIRKIYINLQFLAEALVLTFLGGLVGIFLGWVSFLALSGFLNITPEISLFSILLAFGVSAAIGIIFGFYPACRAATLNPIEALRYEQSQRFNLYGEYFAAGKNCVIINAKLIEKVVIS